MSNEESKNCNRRASFPPFSPPQLKHQKRNTEPSPSQISVRLLKQQQLEDKMEKKRLEKDFNELKNPQGRQYSQEENGILLCILHGIMINEEVNEEKAIRYTFNITQVLIIITLSSILSQWKSSHQIPFS